MVESQFYLIQAPSNQLKLYFESFVDGDSAGLLYTTNIKTYIISLLIGELSFDIIYCLLLPDLL
jgi:hypothetical protein